MLFFKLNIYARITRQLDKYIAVWSNGRLQNKQNQQTK